MEIWLWAGAACAISYVALGKKKPDFVHLVWFLMPIDMYGIEIAGAIIKPYMLFSVLIFARMIMQGRTVLAIRSRWARTSGILIVLCFLLNMLNNQADSSLKAMLLFPIVWACSVLYASECRGDYREDICNVLLATGIGYGLVYLFAYVMGQMGILIPGAITSIREDPGMYLRLSNAYQGQLIRMVRLRGFTVDPNTMVGTFLYSTLVAFFRLARRQGGKKEILAIVLASFATMQSNSRMGLICFSAIILGGVALGYRIADRKMRNRMKACFLLTGFAFGIILITTDILPNMIESLLERYNNRSGLNDPYGRFTIWRGAIKELWEHGPFFGVGLGQIRNYTELGLDCHNTWLETICAFGMILGGAVNLHFAVLILRSCRRIWKNRNADGQIYHWVMVLGVCGVMLSLLSVDHLAYNYLWYGAVMAADMFGRNQNGSLRCR